MRLENRIDEARNLIYLNAEMTNDFDNTDTVYFEIGGLRVGDFFITSVKKGLDPAIVAHEMLHVPSVADLWDVCDGSNVMIWDNFLSLGNKPVNIQAHRFYSYRPMPNSWQ